LERKSKSLLRLDQWVARGFPELSRRHVREAIESGLVRVRGKTSPRKGQRVSATDSVDCEALRLHLGKLREGNRMLEVPILSEEAEFVVVDKPAGMPGHPLSLFETETVTHWAFARYRELSVQFPATQPTLTPHRLDTGTSGVLIVAKTREAFDRWRRAFHRKEITKRYLAWCWGVPKRDKFEVDLALAHDPGDRRKMVVADGVNSVSPPILTAHSKVEVLQLLKDRGLFLAEIICQTGVTHQVRVHLACEGYPLAGDLLYDGAFTSRDWNPPFHQLRAVELRTSERGFLAPHESFIRAPY
jgi:23S rRNA pseudouridine1911/1915/1917 synthase